MKTTAKHLVVALALALCLSGPGSAMMRCLYIGDAFFNEGKVKARRSMFEVVSETHSAPNLLCVQAVDTRGESKGNVKARITIHHTDGSSRSAFLSGKPKPSEFGTNLFLDCVVAPFDLDPGTVLQCDIRVRGYKLKDGESAMLECLMFPDGVSAESSARAGWRVWLPD